MTDHYSTAKGRVAQAIFVVCLIIGVLLAIGGFITSVASLIIDGTAYGIGPIVGIPALGLIFGGLVAGVGWGVRWLITGRTK